LVNNAGLVKGVDKAGDIKTEDLEVMFATNVTGLINVTQAVLPQMKARGESGAGDIINVGSIAGREPYPGGSIYCATKAAVRSFTDAMRKELIATRIRIIEIDPGQVETEFSVVRFYGDKSKADAVYAGCEPLTPDDIAEIVVFTAGRRENVVVADTLVFPNHQVSSLFVDLARGVLWLTSMLFQGGGYCLAQEVIMSASWSDLSTRGLLQFCIRSLRARRSCRYAFTSCTYVYRIHVHDLETGPIAQTSLLHGIMCTFRKYLAVMSSHPYPPTSTDPKAACRSSSCLPNPDAP
jgi:hypothetical protein